MLVFGRRLYGRILHCEPSYVATWFLHVWFIPIIPVGSVVVLEPLDGGNLQIAKTRFNWRSAGVALLRGWSVFLLLHGLLSWAEADPEASALYGPIVSALALAGIVAGFFVVGRVSEETRARHDVYRAVFGYPVDLSLLVECAESLSASLRERLIASGRGTAMNYRATYDPATQWGEMALDPMMTDRDFLVHAMCLARVERGAARGEARDALDALHDRIWARLRSLGPAPIPAWSGPQPQV